MNNQAIEIHNLVKGYKQEPVLNGLALEVPQGSIFGLLGKNGAGKTTLIKCVLGLIRPQSGRLTVLGEEPWKLSESVKEKIGYVPQEDSLYPWLTVREMVDYTASFYQKWNRLLVNKLLSEWELAPQHKVGLLSVGQVQKLAIILALGHEPELLIFDEPVASLDPAARRQFLKTILEIVADRACTIFFSTHITSDLERVADRVALLKKGQIDFCGELDVLKDEVKRLRVSALHPLGQPLEIDGLIHVERSAQDALLTVRRFHPEMKGQLEAQWGASLAVEDLNLEEIFLELNR